MTARYAPIHWFASLPMLASHEPRDDPSLLKARALTVPQIRFLADPTAKFTKALELDFDGSAIFGGARSKRYALLIKDGKVSRMEVEPDKTGLDGMLAELPRSVDHTHWHSLEGGKAAELNGNMIGWVELDGGLSGGSMLRLLSWWNHTRYGIASNMLVALHG